MHKKLENKLKVLRAEKNITQEELGKSCGLSRQSINAIEKGKYIPTVLSALKIANYFGVGVEEIFKINKGLK
jgi:putative transcriptional regulator